MDVDMEGSLDSMLGGRRDLRQRLRLEKRETENATNKAKSLTR